MSWIVKIVKVPTQNDFRTGFFPRRVHYKRDAEELKREVEQKDGQATIEKATK